MSNKLKPEKIQELREYFEEGLTPSQASERVGVACSTAYNYLKKFKG